VSRCFTICPIGSVDQGILKHLRMCISNNCDFVCRVSPALEHPDYAYDTGRRQYDSKSILKRLLECCPHDTLRFMGVTAVDLYIPILKYVYGLAQLEGRCSLISIHRLRPEFYEHPPNPDLLLSRVEKTALHELGHTFGLTHCRVRQCVMHSSTRIEDTDFKKPQFCPTCFELMRWYMKNP
jgi:archaemetzincin